MLRIGDDDGLFVLGRMLGLGGGCRCAGPTLLLLISVSLADARVSGFGVGRWVYEPISWTLKPETPAFAGDAAVWAINPLRIGCLGFSSI